VAPVLLVGAALFAFRDRIGLSALWSAERARSPAGGTAVELSPAPGGATGASGGPGPSPPPPVDPAHQEAERAARRERERRARYDALVRDALAKAVSEDYAGASEGLEAARRVRDDPGLVALERKVRRLQHLAAARAAEIAGDADAVLAAYESALAIEPDPPLAAHVAKTRRRIELARQRVEADRLLAAGEWRAAREALSRAVALADEGSAAPLREAIARVDAELAFARHVREAEEHVRARRWQAAIRSARAADALKPDAGVVGRITTLVERTRGPAPEIENAIGMRLVLVPDGTFTMGSAEGLSREQPEHEVAVSAFYIGAHEVTNAQFELFDPDRRAKRNEFSPADDMPVVHVSWREAMFFCRWLSVKDGGVYRLPTEAEWERAARFDGGVYPWGNAPPNEGDEWRCNVAPFRNRKHWALDGHEFASTVGSFPRGATSLGVHDLAGNVLEWCLDWYHSSYYSEEAVRDPRGPQTGRHRVVRGGSYMMLPTGAAAYRRDARAPTFADAYLGFRVVREVSTVGTRAGARRP
jgi:formylglycine-generating enzyme required for sulfatase activity